MRKNLSIVELNQRGQGIAYCDDGAMYFVDGALPGEQVDVENRHVAPGYTRAKITRIHQAHEGRIAPFCPVAESCGGCTLQHLSYPYHAGVKSQIVQRAFDEAGVTIPPFPVHLAQQDQGWRVRTNLAVQAAGLRALPGLYAMDSQGIVGTTTCPVDHPRLNALRTQLIQLPELRHLPGWSPQNQTGLRHLLLRTNDHGDTQYIGLVGRAVPHDDIQAALQACMTLPAVHGSVWLEQDPDTNSLFRSQRTMALGSDTIDEKVLGRSFSMPALGFVQQHRQQSEALLRHVLAAIGQTDEPATELFAGSGILACLLAQHGQTIEAWESAPDALQCFARNLHNSGHQANVTVHKANLYQSDVRVCTANRIVVADPPRKGLGHALLAQLSAEPAHELHYISCNPNSAAKDVAKLLDAGYTLETFSAWDLFPWTTHVELYICLKT